MNIPDGVVELIEKNKQISNEEDHRLRDEIRAVRQELKESDERHRQNENQLFEKIADTRELVSCMKCQK